MDLEAVIAASLSRTVAVEIAAMARHVAANHGEVRAVLAYGSCLRGVATTESLIDLYVLTEDLAGVSPSRLSRWACAVAPPNVYYAECTLDDRVYRAKYAVLPLSLFAAWMTRGNPYFWARFGQPAALVAVKDQAARQAVVAALAAAARSLFGHARGLSTANDPLDIWAAGLRATYATELRAESADRAAQIVAADLPYYREVAEALADLPPIRANWRWKRFAGKLWSVIRLAKAAFTFTGGADYLAWKIERHSGQRIVLSDWQRRHPILAGVMLLPQLLSSKAIR